MGLKGKLVGEFEVNSSAENFHHQFRHKPHHISAFSQIVQDCELHGGDFGEHGSTICWRYNELGEFEVNSSAENFHHQFRHKPHHISAFSQIVQDCELHGGEFGQPGSTICWRYNELDGKMCSAKQVVEFDEDSKKIVFTVIEGDLMVDYTNFIITLESISREGQNDVVRWTIDYEKIHEDSPHPVKTLDVLLNVGKHIEIDHVNKPYAP